jgi:carbonic anhydrase
MKHAKPLPAYLIQRYHGWKATGYAQNKAWYRQSDFLVPTL